MNSLYSSSEKGRDGALKFRLLYGLLGHLFSVIAWVIIDMKKLLDSGWPRAVQFKCKTSAKSVTPVPITNSNSRLWLAERLSQWYHLKWWRKFCAKTEFEKVFLEWEKLASRNIIRHFLHDTFYIFFSISNRTVCLVESGISKSWNRILRSGPCNFSCLKISLWQINSKLNSKLGLITYTKKTILVSSFL